jgi:hypothetical protein
MVDCERAPNRGRSIVTLLGEDPQLWDTVFPEPSLRASYVYDLQ